MLNQIDNFLKETTDGNTKSISARIPEKLEELLKKKSKEKGYHEKEFAVFLRETLVMAVLPEMLKDELKETNEIWFINQSKDVLEFSIGKPASMLQKIKLLAEYGIEEYRKYFDEITQAEIRLKNDMHKKIAEEIN